MKWTAIFAVAALLAVSLLGAGIVRDWRVDGDFPAIRAKSSETQVKQLMGEPGEVQPSCRAFDIQLIGNCDHVFIYRSIFYPVRGKYWLVFFDKNKQVTATSSELEP